MNDYPTQTLTFVKRHESSSTVATYVFAPETPVSFEAGQYAHMRLLSLPEDIRRVREFSFASAPHETDIWFGVDSRSGSDYQKALQALTPGDVVELFKIKGHMTWPTPHKEVVMIAQGIGITPFRSMLRDREHKALPVHATLVHVAREEHLYKDELENMAESYYAIARGDFEKTIEDLVHTQPAAHYYVAGSPAFVDAATEWLKGQGVVSIESDAFKGLLEE